jgi:hypothetical protein
MNLENLRTKLIASARSNVPSEGVPYAFEKRVMARLRDRRAEDLWSLWAKGLWKGAVACAAVTALSILVTVWTLPASGDVNDAATFEVVVLAGADELTESW